MEAVTRSRVNVLERCKGIELGVSEREESEGGPLPTHGLSLQILRGGWAPQADLVSQKWGSQWWLAAYERGSLYFIESRVDGVRWGW